MVRLKPDATAAWLLSVVVSAFRRTCWTRIRRWTCAFSDRHDLLEREQERGRAGGVAGSPHRSGRHVRHRIIQILVDITAAPARPLNPRRINSILENENGRWIMASFDRLRTFGYRFDTY